MDVRVMTGGRPSGRRPQQIRSGIVSTEKPAPTDFNDPVYVVETGHSTELSYPLSWDATHGNTKPAQGTPVLLAEDERGVLHIVKWEGQHS